MDLAAQIGMLLAGGTERVWQGDAECVYQSAQPYRQVLTQLARLTGSVFAPQAISETWLPDHDHGWTICVRATLHGQPLTLWIPRRGDYLDLRVLIGINRLLQTTGYQFEVLPDAADVLIMWVTSREKVRIEQALDRSCQRFAAADAVAFFMATVEVRLAQQDYGGLISDATALLADGPHATVYAVRGRAAYESGQRDAAWLDWAQAAQHGWGAVYAQVVAWYGREATGPGVEEG